MPWDLFNYFFFSFLVVLVLGSFLFFSCLDPRYDSKDDIIGSLVSKALVHPEFCRDPKNSAQGRIPAFPQAVNDFIKARGMKYYND